MRGALASRGRTLAPDHASTTHKKEFRMPTQATSSQGANTTTGHRLAERFAETLNAHDLDAFSTLLHPDYVNHNRYAEPGKAGSVAIFGTFIDAFDDFRVEVDDIIDSENTVVGR